MKKSMLVLLMVTAIPSFALDTMDGILSRRLVNTSVAPEPLPKDLHFAADQIKVLDASWYLSIFGPRDCEFALSNKESDTTVEILANGPESLELYLNGRITEAFAGSKAHFIPVYYHLGSPIHPHYLVKLKDWILLHISIHKSKDQKDLVISLVQGRGENLRLVPILEATGY